MYIHANTGLALVSGFDGNNCVMAGNEGKLFIYIYFCREIVCTCML